MCSKEQLDRIFGGIWKPKTTIVGWYFAAIIHSPRKIILHKHPIRFPQYLNHHSRKNLLQFCQTIEIVDCDLVYIQMHLKQEIDSISSREDYKSTGIPKKKGAKSKEKSPIPSDIQI